MGCYDSYYSEETGEVQIKAGERLMREYVEGSQCDLQDGIYVGYEGVVVVKRGRVVAVTKRIFDKWGGDICEKVLEIISSKNPGVEVMKEFEKRIKNEL